MKKRKAWFWALGTLLAIVVVLFVPLPQASGSGACAPATGVSECNDHGNIDYANPANLFGYILGSIQ